MTTWVDSLAGIGPISSPPEGLDAALTTLDADHDTAALVAAADTLAGGTVLTTLLVTVLVPGGLRPLVVVLGSLLAAGGWWAITHGPLLLAAARRRRALGTAPWLVARAAMRLRVTPTVEAAAAFAANDDDRLLSRRLAAHVRRARGTPRSGFEAFREEWGARFPPLDRAVATIRTAAESPADDRAAVLDRALETVLDGVRHRAADHVAALRGPVTALYAFGVLLPLALVAALPAAAVAGVPVTVPVLVVGYDLLLPAVLVVASGWVVARRPITFPSARVPRTHPDVPTRRWPRLGVGLATGAASGLVAHIVVADWAAPIAAAGVGGGVVLVLRFRHERTVRARVTELEASLPTVLTRVGRAVADGDPVERALVPVAEELSGPSEAVLQTAIDRMAQFGVGVEDAFIGAHGALATVPSPRAEGLAQLLAAAAHEGRPAGPSLIAAGEHLAALHRVERETERSLRRLTTTMDNTAAVFGPLVGGVTVALAGRIHGSDLGQALPVDVLGPVVGWYVLVLATVLTGLATGLQHGFDRAVVGYRVGVALVAATATYLVAHHVTQLVT